MGAVLIVAGLVVGLVVLLKLRRPPSWQPPFGIQAFCGYNGSGKTMVAVEELVLPALRAGFVVASNVRLQVEKLGFSAHQFVPLTSWRQILRLGVHSEAGKSITGNRPCVLLLDEATACLPARAHQSTPAELLSVLDQFRKHDIAVGITVPNFGKIEKFLRGCIMAVVYCEGGNPDPWLRDETKPRRTGWRAVFAPGYPVLRDAEGRKMAWEGLWGANRTFWVSVYRADAFEDASRNVIDKLEPLAERRVDRRRGDAMLLVNTREAVNLLDYVQEGRCAHCGKRVRETYCDGKACPGQLFPSAEPVAA